MNALDKGGKSNAKRSATETLSLLSEQRASDAQESDRELIVHEENARPLATRLSVELSEDNRMKTAPYPPYSSDITPSDFCSSVHIKRCLAGRSFVDATELFEAARWFFDGIEKVTLQTVFLEWIDRVGKWIQTKSEHTE
jgi:hypothetical protein